MFVSNITWSLVNNKRGGLKSYTITQLKKHCNNFGLPIDGNKPDLVDRLLKYKSNSLEKTLRSSPKVHETKSDLSMLIKESPYEKIVPSAVSISTVMENRSGSDGKDSSISPLYKTMKYDTLKSTTLSGGSMQSKERVSISFIEGEIKSLLSRSYNDQDARKQMIIDSVDNPNDFIITEGILRQIYDIYDKYFFDHKISTILNNRGDMIQFTVINTSNIAGKYSFITNPTAGRTSFYQTNNNNLMQNAQSGLPATHQVSHFQCGENNVNEEGICHNKYHLIHTISISRLIFDKLYMNGEKSYLSNGLLCYNRLSALTNVFEHELIHLIIKITDVKEQSHGPTFQKLAKDLFGHTDFRHNFGSGEGTELLKMKETVESLKAGDTVCFKIKGYNQFSSQNGVKYDSEYLARILIVSKRTLTLEYYDGIVEDNVVLSKGRKKIIRISHNHEFKLIDNKIVEQYLPLLNLQLGDKVLCIHPDAYNTSETAESTDDIEVLKSFDEQIPYHPNNIYGIVIDWV